ncbi:nucleolar GTP-binding protein [Methanohalophilus levihalophilus]|uniref:NOG1 family protein n=1 Tax=Methanohalophilus levihalophilus TaxID=1431282 RepID=UPI001AE8BCBD|nr:NOG1 family protein [Methanohalophilus levihalophilus]MBP2030624.1 nucleolar GTP-binding protein [Methanohalophilus levihalophilus]
MIFEKINTVPTSDELVDKAFRRGTRAMAGKDLRGREALLKANESMMLTAANILSDNLGNIVRRFPSFEHLPPFYYDMVDIIADVDDLRQALSRIGWASSKIHEISRQYVQKIRKSESPQQVRKQAFGRMASIMASIEDDLLYLNVVRNKLRTLPDVRDEPTIVVAGYPNVGKSSFVSSITGATPEIASYPFTTKGVSIGHFIRDDVRYQVIDTPGLLDRPMADRNEAEMQAIAALKHLDAIVFFILDPSEYCGYEMKDQLQLMNEVKEKFPLPMLVGANKIDLNNVESEATVQMSTMTGEGVDEALDELVKMLNQEVIKEPLA